MALKVLKVTLNSDNVLDVADGGQTRIKAAQGEEIIVWALSGANLKNAVFADETPTGSGFTWIDKSTGIFSPPLLSANRRRIILEDDHGGNDSKGEFTYMLSALVPDPDDDDKPKLRTTTHGRGKKRRKKGDRTSNNPVIINH